MIVAGMVVIRVVVIRVVVGLALSVHLLVAVVASEEALQAVHERHEVAPFRGGATILRQRGRTTSVAVMPRFRWSASEHQSVNRPGRSRASSSPTSPGATVRIR